MEGVWLSFKENNFMFDKIMKYSWEEINDPDVFNKIILKIGKK